MSPWLELPYEIQNVTPEEDKLIKKCLIGYTKTFVQCSKKKYTLPGAFRKNAETLYNFKVRPDDTWVITFPRSGTTWTQEMVWLLQNDLNFAAAKEKPLYDRFPMLEVSSHIPEIAFELIKVDFMNLAQFQGLSKAVRVPSWKSLEDAPSPRFIKTHLPLSLLPPNLLNTAKVIYVARDPRDVVVSYFYLYKMTCKSLLRCTFRQFWEAFRKDLLPWMPIIPHAHEAWKLRNHQNLHFMFYEDMLEDLPKMIRNVADFLGKKDYSDEEIDQLADHLSFSSLRKNKNVNNTTDKDGVQFVRKGESGSWISHFDDEMKVEVEEYLTKYLRGIDMKYPTINIDKFDNTHL